MLQRIDDPTRPARKVVLEGQLVIRGSSRGPDGGRG
jgi:LacI family fructose operon transcriptional repressor